MVAASADIVAVACFAGPLRSSFPCDVAEPGERGRFAHKGLQPSEALTIVVELPKGAVADPVPILEERWSPARAFSATRLSVGPCSCC